MAEKDTINFFVEISDIYEIAAMLWENEDFMKKVADSREKN